MCEMLILLFLCCYKEKLKHNVVKFITETSMAGYKSRSVWNKNRMLSLRRMDLEGKTMN